MKTTVSLFIALFLIGCSENPEPEVSLDGKIITSDIENFLVVYEAIQEGADPVTTIQTGYFDPGSQGLHDFIELRIESPEKMAKALDDWPEIYQGVATAYEKLPDLVSEIELAFSKMQELYPDTIIPTTYFLVGRRNSGGTVSENGLLIGVEVFSNNPGVIPPLVAHEMIHFQQSYNGDEELEATYPLFKLSIGEGAADFFGELISGGNTNAHIYEYGYANECQLWNEFHAEKDVVGPSGWLYGEHEGLPEYWDARPSDLGYFMGYRITQSYYENAADKQAAVVEILNIEDFEDFLEKSGYPAKMAACGGE